MNITPEQSVINFFCKLWFLMSPLAKTMYEEPSKCLNTQVNGVIMLQQLHEFAQQVLIDKKFKNGKFIYRLTVGQYAGFHIRHYNLPTATPAGILAIPDGQKLATMVAAINDAAEYAQTELDKFKKRMADKKARIEFVANNEYICRWLKVGFQANDADWELLPDNRLRINHQTFTVQGWQRVAELTHKHSVEMSELIRSLRDRRFRNALQSLPPSGARHCTAQSRAN